MTLAAVQDGGTVVVDPLFIVDPIVCGGFVFGPCFVMSFLVLQSTCRG